MRIQSERDLRLNDEIIIKNIEELISVWHGGIDKLYGNFELTFTAHTHLHLPQQV
jgi:hypothetical protein